jgi:ribonuclease E
VLRSLEDQLLKGVTHHLTIRTRTPVALYILNQKRAHLSEIEQRFGLSITVSADETITTGAHFIIERGEPVEPRAASAASITPASFQPVVEEEPGAAPIEPEPEEEIAADEPEVQETRGGHDRGDETRDENGQHRGRRRRRGRGRGGEGRPGEGRSGERPLEHQPSPAMAAQNQPRPEAPVEGAEDEGGEQEGGNGAERPFVAGELGPDGLPRKRRRGRRGGRRGRRGRGGEDRPNENRPFDQNRGGGAPRGDQQPASFERQPFGMIAADEDEIDTTPTLDPRPGNEPPRRIEIATLDDAPDDEIDTTPQPERPKEVEPRAAEPARESDPATEQEEEDPNRPKRSGWWQRRTFF